VTGRIFNGLTKSALDTFLGLEASAADLPQPSWNIAPTDRLPLVWRLGRKRQKEAVTAKWGLISGAPVWKGKHAREGVHCHARAETLAKKPAFREAFALRRGMIVASGFYVWTSPYPSLRNHRRAFAVTRADGKPMTIACLWDAYTGQDPEPFPRVAMVTVAAEGWPPEPDARFPALLPPEAWPMWLGEVDATQAQLWELLKPCGRDQFRFWPVSDRVNDSRNDDEGLVWPVGGAA